MEAGCGASVWPAAVYCGPGGTCVNVTAGDGGRCVCDWPTWTADRTFFKMDGNCCLPNPAMSVVEAVVGFTALVVGLMALRLSTTLLFDSKKLMRLTSVSMFCTAAYMLAHNLEGNQHGAASVLFMVLSVALISSCITVSLYVLLKTAWLFAGKAPMTLKVLVSAFQAAEVVGLLACAIVMWTNLNNSVQFTYGIAAFVCVFVSYYLVLIFFFWKMSLIIKILEKSSGSPVAIPDPKILLIINRIKLYRKLGAAMGLAVASVSSVCVVLLLAAHTIPGLCFIYMFVLLQMPLLGVLQIIFSRPAKLGKSSNSNSANAATDSYKKHISIPNTNTQDNMNNNAAAVVVEANGAS